jgi:hypothetical protein
VASYPNKIRHFYFQIIAGVVNIENYLKNSQAQVRRILNSYPSIIADVDLAIAKVHPPFKLMNTVQVVTLAPPGSSPPGNEQFYNYQKILVVQKR